MKARSLTLHSPHAIRDILVGRGWVSVQAEAAAAGLAPQAILLDEMAPEDVEGLRAHAFRCGIDCLTGENWVMLAGSWSGLSSLGRPDRIPAELWSVIECMTAALQSTLPPVWNVRDRSIALGGPVIFGILNVTPDSFSDGGRFVDPDAALAQAGQLLEAGADGIDVGGESTRPGQRDALPAADEWERLAAVLAGLRREFPEAIISVDTAKSEVAARALDTGVAIINDVTGLRHDPRIAATCAGAGAGLILMHSRGPLGRLATYDGATYPNGVAAAIAGELEPAARFANEQGVGCDRLVLDPGLGFQKRPEHNWEALRDLRSVTALGYPVMVGPSRKRFLGDATGAPIDRRDAATATTCALAWREGARLFRVHDVAATREALAIATAWEGI